MDDLMFANLPWPKVTLDHECAERGKLGSFRREVALILLDINAISDTE
jgi:hypothetical protein